MPGSERVRVMSKEFDHYQQIFNVLLEADAKVWEAVAAIQDEEGSSLEGFIYPLMEMRGSLHTKFFRPMYQQFPGLAAASGMDAPAEN